VRIALELENQEPKQLPSKDEDEDEYEETGEDEISSE
jgi:hypothetical protein